MADYVPNGIPFYRGKEVIERAKGNAVSTELFIAQTQYFEIKRKFGSPQNDDILLTSVGTLGVAYFIMGDGDFYFKDGNVTWFRNFDANVVPKYVYYWLTSPETQKRLDEVSIGSTQRALTISALKALQIQLPSIKIQKAIVEMLDAITDRITLLRETNATLEAIAQALFKSWFVDFDPVRAKMEGRAPEGMDEATAALFPDALEESELGDLPKGWRVGALKDCCTKVQSGGTPKRTVPEYWNGGISWLTSGEVRSPIVFDTKEKITEEGLAGSSAKLWPVGTTVVAMYGATAGEVCVIASPMTANQACCGLIPKADFRTFLFFCTRREREVLASKSSGSAQQNLNKGLVEAHPIILPSREVVAAFDTTVGSLLDSWIASDQQAQTLSTLRDTLLPRLISGQLRLPEAQTATEAALGGALQT